MHTCLDNLSILRVESISISARFVLPLQLSVHLSHLFVSLLSCFSVAAVDINVLLREGPLGPVGTVPVLAPVVHICAINIANVLRLKPIERQLRLVFAPGAVFRVYVGKYAPQDAIIALVHISFDHQICDEGPDFVIKAAATTMWVHHVSTQQDVERCELEGVNVH